MPELPEVETVVRSLRPLLLGRTITNIDLPSSTNGKGKIILRRLLATPASQFQEQLCGARVDSIRRHGKNLLLTLSKRNGQSGTTYLLIHLGMTGRLIVEPTQESTNPHTHFIFTLDSPSTWLHFSDPRRFGKLRIIADPKRDSIDNLGPDPLEISLEDFLGHIRARRAMLKSLLLDQGFLRGLGNIYADESLFRAGIH